MKKRLKIERRKMFIKILSVFLLISIVVSGIYIYIVYNSEKELFINEASEKVERKISDLYCAGVPSEDYMKYYLMFVLNNDKSINSEISIKDEQGKIITQTSNVLNVNFFNESSDSTYGLISYDSFRESMSDEQYNKITEMLLSTPNTENQYYELLATEYYVDDNEEYIYPKTVQIVLTEKDNTWYVQDKVIETFNLNVNPNDSDTLRKIGDTYRNLINTDFVLGYYKEQNLLETVYNEIEKQNLKLEDDMLIRTDFLNFIYYHNSQEYLYGERDGYLCTYQKVQYEYTESINLLDICINRIGLMFLYTVILFLICGTVVAIISWKTLEKQIKIEQKQRTFINSMAHELKTPLFIIRGNTDNLLEYIDSDEETHFANTIIEQVNTVNSLVHNMLELSSLEVQNLNLNKSKLNLAEFTSNMLLKFSEIYPKIHISFESCQNAIITADKKLIECALKNLIENSIKYTDNKSSIKINIAKNTFEISNSIDKNTNIDLKQIWEPYQRFDNSFFKEGNGLGLSIVKTIFEAHNFKYSANIENSIITFKFIF